ncbi:MAG: dTDP-4-keto-6-deoxy-D-glucose epimerase, partial [Gammaproteobacteria bacterium]|nr:dTDP-4-keto-6-deoxy-D-glucose epimerase [Gammaproteobacteria bacterium]
PEYERCIRWNDPDLDVRWPENIKPIISNKDAEGDTFLSAEVFP